jgi:hypothetical protein
VPKHDYTYRIDSAKLNSAIQYAQQSLNVKPGVMRNIKVAGHIFRNMPVYERGGTSVQSLFEGYCAVYDTQSRVGRDTFSELLHLLSKRGETKAGLSTYSINLRYAISIFKLMLDKIGTFDYADNTKKLEAKARIKELKDEWDSIFKFILWEYANVH